MESSDGVLIVMKNLRVINLQGNKKRTKIFTYETMRLLLTSFSGIMIILASMLPTAYSSDKINIIKRGTIDCDLVEATPVVFKGKLYRFEYVRKSYKPNKTESSYFRFIDIKTGKPTRAFAVGYNLGSAFVDGDTAYVYCVKGWGSPTIYVFGRRIW